MDSFLFIITNACQQSLQLIASNTCFSHDSINQTKTVLEYGKVQNNKLRLSCAKLSTA